MLWSFQARTGLSKDYSAINRHNRGECCSTQERFAPNPPVMLPIAFAKDGLKCPSLEWPLLERTTA